jgi:outer membrane protein OmpU
MEELIMKKVLLSTAAAALALALSAPAQAATANGISVGVGGQFNGYVVWGRQSTAPGNKDRSLFILRDTNVTVQGEDTLDNGLTVGIYNEFNIDGTQGLDGTNPISATTETVGTVATKESYAYFSGGWGRVNFGKEDGANYLLQVAAPSADSNIDGLRQLVNPVNYHLTNATGFTHDGVNLDKWYNTMGIDYSADATGDYNKLTYLTPVFSGFQFGISYTPDVNNFGPDTTGLAGATQSNNSVGGNPTFGSAWEASGRYEGKWQNADITLGGGYTNVNEEARKAGSGFDPFKQWDLGGNVGWEAFNFGLAYVQDNGGQTQGDNNKTWDAGVDYTTGPYKLGFSYLNNKMQLDSTVQEADTDRYTGGVVYSYGPGMTFRGSVSYVKTALPNVSDVTATDVLVGSQINF